MKPCINEECPEWESSFIPERCPNWDYSNTWPKFFQARMLKAQVRLMGLKNCKKAHARGGGPHVRRKSGPAHMAHEHAHVPT